MEKTIRELKGVTIAGLGNQIKRITPSRYLVHSQSSDNWYEVRQKFDGKGWTCSCPDHINRKVICKHLWAVHISKEFRSALSYRENAIEIPQPQIEMVCYNCGSEDVIKNGQRKNRKGNTQKFCCKQCGHNWSDNLGFVKNKIPTNAITAGLDLYFKGISLRQIRQHLIQFYGINISHVAIYKWIRKFGEVVTPFVDKLMPPHLSKVYHVDEMMVHVKKAEIFKGHYQWLWNVMDNSTRFWISSKISNDRRPDDARVVYQDAKKKSPTPIAIVHDGLKSYNEAYWKEYYTHKNPRVKDIRSISVRHDGINQKVEALNGIFRTREYVMKGMDNPQSAQRLVEAFRTNYNFLRKHGSLGKTPAEQAGIKLDLGQNKIENLIKLASKKD
jgi:transposase-like protein